ncbi:MAG: hypothetical protein ACE3L7_24445 [Candidatus Pristimantibacillus sp.]
MNAGYVSLWIMTIALILIATGWSDYVGVSLNRTKLTIVTIVCVILHFFQMKFSVGHIDINLHAGVVVAMAAALMAMRGPLLWDSKYYLLTCALLTGMIWGSIRKMYMIDPVFFWFDPRWDAPLLGGLLAAAFSTKATHQFTVLLFSAAFSEIMCSLLQGGLYVANIGSLAWWDGFWVSYVCARMISVLFNLLRICGERFIALSWRKKGGSTPE